MIAGFTIATSASSHGLHARASIPDGFLWIRLFPLSSNLIQQPFELFPVHPESPHVGPDDVLPEVPIHLDDDRPSHA